MPLHTPDTDPEVDTEPPAPAGEPPARFKQENSSLSAPDRVATDAERMRLLRRRRGWRR